MTKENFVTKVVHDNGCIQYLFEPESVTLNFSENDIKIIQRSLDEFPGNKLNLSLKDYDINDFDKTQIRSIEFSVQQLLGVCDIDDVEDILIVFQKIDKLKKK